MLFTLIQAGDAAVFLIHLKAGSYHRKRTIWRQAAAGCLHFAKLGYYLGIILFMNYRCSMQEQRKRAIGLQSAAGRAPRGVYNGADSFECRPMPSDAKLDIYLDGTARFVSGRGRARPGDRRGQLRFGS